MYYTGLDPRTMQPVYTAKSQREKDMQRALLQWKRPEKRALVIAALREAGRTDLIGFGPECLVRPDSRRGGAGPSRRPAEPEKKEKPAYKAGWAKPKKKPNARPGGGKRR